MQPIAYVGSAEGGGIYALDEGYSDHLQDIHAVAQASPLAPGGSDADCGFDRLFIVLTWSMPATVRCTPIVDKVDIAAAVFDIELPAVAAGTRRSHVFERMLRMPFLVDGVESYRHAPRGTWFALRMETVGGLADGDLIFDEVVLEYDVLSPTKGVVA